MKKLLAANLLIFAMLTTILAQNTPELSIYEGNDLGLTYSPTASTIKIWAPTAVSVMLRFYKKDLRTGERACPFNSLYWQFHDRHRPKLERNPRIGMVYRTWDKMSGEARAAALEQAGAYLDNLETL